MGLYATRSTRDIATQMQLRGALKGHENWVTSIATPLDNSDILLSSSRDKTVILWNLTREEENYGYPRRSLHGHSHFVQDVVISSDGQFALSGSWDGTLRLWDLNPGTTTRRFVGHTKDVLSVAFSVDNRQIVSGSRIRRSSCGTRSASASTRFKTPTRTPSGCRACASPRSPPTRSSCLGAGISS